MKVLFSSLKEWTSLSLSPEEIAELLTNAGLEVDQIEALEGGDYLFEISLTPNLGHCLSTLGVARELAAAAKKPLKSFSSQLSENRETACASLIEVTVKNPEKCPYYGCRIVRSVKVGPSPEWLKKRLELLGLGSVNNVVDIGNYLMLEFGTPLHLFDYDTLANKKIEVTCHSPEKTFKALNDKSYELPKEALVISDTKSVLALAGIIGSAHSSITASTQTVLIESAQFDASSVRKSCKITGLRSDSSYRFERGVDPVMAQFALDKAAQLLCEIASGDALFGRVEKITKSLEKKKIALRCSRIKKLTRIDLDRAAVTTLLAHLEISSEADPDDADLLHCSIPTYRADLSLEIDLIEEVCRIHGYQNIPVIDAKYSSSNVGHDPLYLFENKMRKALQSEGLQEWMSCCLVTPAEAHLTIEKGVGRDKEIPVLSEQQLLLRTSLLASMLPCLRVNEGFNNQNLNAFEIGKVFFKDQIEQKERYIEQFCLAILLKGNKAPTHFSKEPQAYDLLDLKGIVENLLATLSIENSEFVPSDYENFHPYQQGSIQSGECTIGVLGQLHPQHLAQMDLTGPIYFAQLNLHHLMRLEKKVPSYSAISNFPGSERDWTITVKEQTSVQTLLDAFLKTGALYLEDVNLTSIYRNSEKLGTGVKNVTFRFFYRDPAGTISSEVVDSEHAKIKIDVAEKLADCILGM